MAYETSTDTNEPAPAAASPGRGPGQIGTRSLTGAAANLAPLIAAHAEELERARRMPAALVTAWRDARLTDLWLPIELGGAETDPESVFELVESVAALDGAVGWNLLIAISAGLFGAYLPEAAARTIWSSECVAPFVSGSFAPTGRALIVEGGYRVSGRWPFASGVQYADWVCGNCVVFDGERPRTCADGTPQLRLMFLPVADATVLDTWYTGGMRGTGSHDFAVQDVFVPEGFWFEVLNDHGRVRRPLYRLTFLTWFGPAVAMLMLGIARHAVEALVALASDKVPAGSRALLKERPLAQLQVAHAEALVGSARAFLLQMTRDVWASFEAAGEPSELERTRLNLSAVYAADNAVEAVELMYKASGGSAVYSNSVLDRCIRDVHVAAQHIAVSGQHYQAIGKALLGGRQTA
jgi:indole-3-acetate monooxygenase